MRVLVSSTSGMGHVQPMLPLAAALRERGHDVVWATATDAHAMLEAQGFATLAAGPSWRDRRDEYWSRFPESRLLTGDARVAHMFPYIFGSIGTVEMFEALAAFGRTWGPDLIVSERAELAAPVAARVLGVPQVTHGYGLVVPPDWLQAASDAAAEMWARAGQAPRPLGGGYDYAYSDPYPPSMQPEDLSYIGRIYRIRPGVGAPEPHASTPEWLRRVLDDGRPIVYATSGTIFNEPALLGTVAAALAVRSDLVAVLTVGPGVDPSVLGQQPEHIRVTDYVPQNQLLSHASLAVSHAGSGTLLGALSHGVPQVCVPQAADQLRNARAAQQAGAAISVFPDDLTVEAVVTAMDLAISSDEVRSSAHRISQEIAGMPSATAVALRVEALAGSI